MVYSGAILSGFTVLKSIATKFLKLHWEQVCLTAFDGSCGHFYVTNKSKTHVTHICLSSFLAC